MVPGFPRKECERLFHHWLEQFSLCTAERDCGYCRLLIDEVFRPAVAKQLFTIFNDYQRTSAGSNISVLHQGDMTVNEAFHIVQHVSRERIEDEYERHDGVVRDRVKHYAVADTRLKKLLARDFPYLTVEDLGPSLPLNTGHIVPLIRHNTLYQVLHTLYVSILGLRSAVRLPEHVLVSFVVICFNVQRLATLTPNTVYRLPAYDIVANTLLISDQVRRSSEDQSRDKEALRQRLGAPVAAAVTAALAAYRLTTTSSTT